MNHLKLNKYLIYIINEFLLPKDKMDECLSHMVGIIINIQFPLDDKNCINKKTMCFEKFNKDDNIKIVKVHNYWTVRKI